MSKSNMLLGLAKGKVGDLVFYRDGGEQRTRTRVVPKNPRSIAQMSQRVKIANVGGLYRTASGVLRNSFTNRPSNMSGYNAFAAGAIDLAPYLTKQMVAANVCLPQPCMMSRGALQSVEVRVVQGEDESYLGIRVLANISEASTIGAVSQALINDYPTLQNGDRLTGVMIHFSADADASEDVDIYHTNTYMSSFVIDTTSTALMSDHDFEVVNGYLCPRYFNQAFDENIRMGAVIVSRVDETGALQCSTENAILSELAKTLYDGYRTDSARLDAIETYRAGSASILR